MRVAGAVAAVVVGLAIMAFALGLGLLWTPVYLSDALKQHRRRREFYREWGREIRK